MLGQAALRGAGMGRPGFRWYVLHVTLAGTSGNATIQAFSLRVNGIWTPTTMTGNTEPSPYVASALRIHSSFPAWQAFDGVESTIDYETCAHLEGGFPNWLAIDMGTPVAASGWRVVGRADSGGIASSGLKDFEIRASNTSATTDLVTLASVTGWSGQPIEITGDL